MIHLKTEQEIHIMKLGGQILKETLDYLLDSAKVGVSLLSLDKMAEDKIRSKGAEPSFQKVPNYHWTCCFSVNDVVVHGVPTTYKLQYGDILGIDCGVYYQGFHTDSAWTILINNLTMKQPTLPAGRFNNETKEKKKFLNTGELALNEAIKQVKSGNRIGHLSKTIQSIIEKEGYSIVKSLTGHGIGRNLHEAPEIPGFLKDNLEKTPIIEKGMVLAVEVIYNLGGPNVVYKGDDGWTIASKDGKISGLFEKTVAVAADGVFVLT